MTYKANKTISEKIGYFYIIILNGCPRVRFPKKSAKTIYSTHTVNISQTNFPCEKYISQLN